MRVMATWTKTNNKQQQQQQQQQKNRQAAELRERGLK